MMEGAHWRGRTGSHGSAWCAKPCMAVHVGYMSRYVTDCDRRLAWHGMGLYQVAWADTGLNELPGMHKIAWDCMGHDEPASDSRHAWDRMGRNRLAVAHAGRHEVQGAQ
eukprot:200232-Chlamydomonas_euryale.AAC.1